MINILETIIDHTIEGEVTAVTQLNQRKHNGSDVNDYTQ